MSECCPQLIRGLAGLNLDVFCMSFLYWTLNLGSLIYIFVLDSVRHTPEGSAEMSSNTVSGL